MLSNVSLQPKTWDQNTVIVRQDYGVDERCLSIDKLAFP
ncbi:hypothetical protein MC7420_189 [Coleofasciculus chthonoplastes PCC 7420]|uniref:Uncharacterized protein n=1 Tax=Coleofasciculus chthonoplastes PCC 7420 TaxID=118168 RepID=B4VLI8_9CYAN|nr:hypothetical protein MC7420_189 [Coleofasciculus chthonoplastes PCC 7420]